MCEFVQPMDSWRTAWSLWITFDEEGRLLLSSRLSAENAERLGLKSGLALTRIDNLHRPALAWHRANCFR